MLKEKKFTHVQAKERDNISILKAQKKSIRGIGKELGRSPSTISREIKRGITHKEHYFSNASQSVIDEKKKKARRKRKTDNPEVQKYIIEKLKPPFQWSPEIISVKIKEELGISIGKDSIYDFIYEDYELTRFLARKHPGKIRKNKDKKTKRTLIPNRVDIKERPVEANERKELGHIEADCIESKRGGSKTALLVMADRASRKTKIKKLARKTAELASLSIVFAFKDYNIIHLKTITYDNGCEFCWHEKVNQELGTKSFFCTPYHAWEKGTVENINGLIRRFFPKGTDFDTITEEQIQQVEDWINNRPMKILGYMTPNQKYTELQQIRTLGS